MSRHAAVTCLLAVVGMLAGCVPHMHELRRESYGFEGAELTYGVYVPGGLPAEAPVPLVVALHRYTENGNAMAYISGFNDVAAREGFIVVYPDGPGNRFDAFNGGRDDVGMVLAVIEEVCSSHAIDRDRIYVTGASNGGFMTFVLAAETPATFAAAAPVMALMPAQLDQIPPSVPRTPVPMLVIHGTDDPIVKWNATEIYAGRSIDVLTIGQSVAYWVRRNGCMTTPRITELPDVDPRDGTRVTELRYEQGEAPVVLYRVEGGGHTWPGGEEPAPGFIVGRKSRDLDATETIWAFFAEHRRVSGTSVARLSAARR